MTLFVSFRTHPAGGSVKGAELFECEHEGEWPSQLTLSITPAALASRWRGKDLLLAAHGFNVSQAQGIRSLGRLADAIGLNESEAFIGILWPGDFWIPAINYPFEGDTAIKCGKYLADFCNRELDTARSISFVSHSLGGRLVLEAAKNLNRKVRGICLTAGAVNRDCLTAQYASTAQSAGGAATLASHWDMVLKLAYPAGDVFADLLHDDHALLTAALGREGPLPSPPDSIHPSQIPDDSNPHYGHGNYFPPTGVNWPSPGPWQKVADYIARTFRNPRERWV